MHAGYSDDEAAEPEESEEEFGIDAVEEDSDDDMAPVAVPKNAVKMLPVRPFLGLLHKAQCGISMWYSQLVDDASDPAWLP